MNVKTDSNIGKFLRNYKTASTEGELSAADEENYLNAYLQQQLEEDVARIFDESIYSDLEVVCGKLKILTHTCILKTRTSKFFHELQNILHVNIGRDTFDEIYSFVSDAYTECNIEQQENEIITYLNDTFNTFRPIVKKVSIPKEDIVEKHSFYIPDCSVNSSTNLLKTKSSSPTIELTKEYYALQSVNGNLLDKELTEQDELSNAFLCIIQTHLDDIVDTNVSQPNKPTSLPLYDVSIKSDTHSNFLSTYLVSNSNSKIKDSNEKFLTNSSQISELNRSCNTSDFISRDFEPNIEKTVDSIYSPDSLITDEPSSSSDYLSATNTCSPGTSISSFQHNLNPADNITKMENNALNVSDSGLDNIGMHECTNSHIDVTLTDISLSENNLHSSYNLEDDENSLQYTESLLTEKTERQKLKFPTSSSGTKINSSSHTNKPECIKSGKSIKEEKQRQNEKIVTLESSSLSSETGSWESIFPLKLTTINMFSNFSKNICIPKEEDKKPDYTNNFAGNEQNLSTHHNLSNVMSDRIEAEDLLEQPNQADNFECNELSTFASENSNSNYVPENTEMNNMYVDVFNTQTANNSIMSLKDKCLPNDSNYSKIQSNKERKSMPIPIKPKRSNDMSITDQTVSTKSSVEYLRRDVDHISMLSSNPIEINDNLHTNKPTKLKSSSGSSCIFELSLTTDSSSTETGRDNDQKDLRNISKNNTKVIKPTIKSESSPLFDMSMTTENSPIEYKESSSEDIKNISKISYDNDQETLNNIGEKVCKNFFIDFSSLPEPTPPHKSTESLGGNEKDKMFSLFVNLPQSSTLKIKPELQSSLRKSTPNRSNMKKINVATKSETPGSVPNKTLLMFEKIELLCNDPTLSITELVQIREMKNACDISDIEKKNNKEKPETVASSFENTTSIGALENPVQKSDDTSNNDYVKLSDLYKMYTKSTDFENIEKKSDKSNTLYEDKVWDARMTRSIPDEHLLDQNICENSLITSFNSDNAISLNRLFPNLKNEFSNSVPSSLSSRTWSPLKLEKSNVDEETQISEISPINSMQSIAGCSGLANSNTEETSHTAIFVKTCQSQLGQDLLRMFLNEIATDVIVEVNNRRIKAHKCILSSRCQFFAGILSGGYVEDAGNVIVLPSFSYNVVHFVLCHIYAGISVIPDSVNIFELATVADMLGLEGLKEAIMFTLKTKYCHHFHKPCQLCIVGVLECLPLSSAYGLDDLYLRCLNWITKNFVKVWPTKAFATLPSELILKCYHQQLINFTTDTLIETVYGYGFIMSSLENCRWGEELIRMCKRLVQAAAHFSAPRLVDLLKTTSCMLLNVTSSAANQAVEECITSAIAWAPPEEACRAYAFLSNALNDTQYKRTIASDLSSADHDKNLSSTNLLYYHAASWRLQLEGVLVSAAPRVVNTDAFQDLPSELRKKLRELGCILFVSHALPQASTSQIWDGRSASNTHSFNMDQVRAAFLPYSYKPTIIPFCKVSLSKKLYEPSDNKKSTRAVKPPIVRMTKAQEQRAIYNKNKAIQNTKAKKANVPAVKSKYLEPRTIKNDKKQSEPTNNNGGLMTSSESSNHTSSSRVPRFPKKRNDKQLYEMKSHPISQDSLGTSSRPKTAEPAIDFFSESRSNKYATYTKVKHTIKGSVESIQTTKCFGTAKDTELRGKKKSCIPIANLNRKNTGAEKAKCSDAKSSDKYLYKISGSLINATKSSSAKIVSKIVKNNSNDAKTAKESNTSNNRKDSVSTLNRSGTFLLDLPTSGNTQDNTTNGDQTAEAHPSTSKQY